MPCHMDTMPNAIRCIGSCPFVCWDMARSWFLGTAMFSLTCWAVFVTIGTHDLCLLTCHASSALADGHANRAGGPIPSDPDRAGDDRQPLKLWMFPGLWYVLEGRSTEHAVMRIILVLVCAIAWVWFFLALPVSIGSLCSACDTATVRRSAVRFIGFVAAMALVCFFVFVGACARLCADPPFHTHSGDFAPLGPLHERDSDGIANSYPGMGRKSELIYSHYRPVSHATPTPVVEKRPHPSL